MHEGALAPSYSIVSTGIAGRAGRFPQKNFPYTALLSNNRTKCLYFVRGSRLCRHSEAPATNMAGAFHIEAFYPSFMQKKYPRRAGGIDSKTSKEYELYCMF